MAEPAASMPSVPPAPAAAARPRSGRARRIVGRFVKIVLLLVAVLLVAALGGWLWLRSQLNASLPRVAGEQALPGLGAPVTVERDALGIPTVRGATRVDVARALGFLHAQERFFQMDLMRRQAAGELAELLGAGPEDAVVGIDKEHRIHRFRSRARQALALTGPAERANLEAYAAGVNAGLAALGAKPFEYIALRAEPAPWRPEDSVLVIYAMFFELQDTGDSESELGLMADVLPAPLFVFLAPQGTSWDAPLVGGAYAQPPVPGPEVFDLRAAPALPKAAALRRGESAAGEDEEALYSAFPGSNNWAVAGSYTADGGALLANDMHLGIGVPNIWYRAVLAWPVPAGDGQAGERRMMGVTLPGTPAVVAGSNGRVAWGFTNSYGDWNDLVILEEGTGGADTYLTPGGSQRITRVSEPIRVKGGREVANEVEETIWGPVIDRDHRNRRRALVWTAHFPEAVDLNISRLEGADTVDEAIEAAHGSGMPAQNFTVADAGGRIGWTIAGRIPRRVGYDGRTPTSWADGTRRWDGWLASAEVPKVVDPPTGRIWTANNRVVDGPELALIGDGGYGLGARARQIRDDLFALEKATPRDLLAVQLDDRALFLTRWRELLLRTLTPEAIAADPRRRELRRLVETTWSGRAAVDSVAYRAVRSFRISSSTLIFDALTASCKQADPDFDGGETAQVEGPLWALVTERPLHLLDPRYQTWDEQMLAAVDRTIGRMQTFGKDLSQRTWGEFNTLRAQHPLSRAVPALGRFLDMPARRLPGDADMPRVQGPGFGASERLVVSPGREAQGIFHMPGGQSGHPRSPHYRDGFDAWAEGEPTPFLPGPAVDTLTLVPAPGRQQ
jgi:penicillin amidase